MCHTPVEWKCGCCNNRLGVVDPFFVKFQSAASSVCTVKYRSIEAHLQAQNMIHPSSKLSQGMNQGLFLFDSDSVIHRAIVAPENINLIKTL